MMTILLYSRLISQMANLTVRKGWCFFVGKVELRPSKMYNSNHGWYNTYIQIPALQTSADLCKVLWNFCLLQSVTRCARTSQL